MHYLTLTGQYSRPIHVWNVVSFNMSSVYSVDKGKDGNKGKVGRCETDREHSIWNRQRQSQRHVDGYKRMDGWM